MGDIEKLDDHRPSKVGYSTGDAVCFACSHEFIATAIPADQTIFSCPNCKTTNAHFMHSFLREDEEHWKCNCGNDLFYITRERIYCPKCGIDLNMENIER